MPNLVSSVALSELLTEKHLLVLIAASASDRFMLMNFSDVLFFQYNAVLREKTAKCLSFLSLDFVSNSPSDAACTEDVNQWLCCQTLESFQLRMKFSPRPLAESALSGQRGPLRPWPSPDTFLVRYMLADRHAYDLVQNSESLLRNLFHKQRSKC